MFHISFFLLRICFVFRFFRISNFTKLAFITFSLLGLLLTFSPKVDAALNVNKFYPKDNGTILLSISDPATGVNTFIINATDTNFLETENASTTLNFDFEFYNADSDEKFDIFTDKDGFDATSSYGDYYYVDFDTDPSKNIRILPSTIDYGFKYEEYGNDKSDQLSFFSKYYKTQESNKIKIVNPSYDYDNDHENFELINPSINISFKLAIPLKLKNERFRENKKGAPQGVLSRTGKMIVDEVIASIQVSSSGIVFDNGLDSITDDELQIINKQEKDTDKKDFEPLSDEGFQGHGIIPPEQNVYKGISNVTDLNEFIIGVANFVLTFVAVVCVLMLTYGGYLWIIDRGEEQLAEKSRKIIAGAVLGLLIIISAYTIVNTIINLDANSSSGAIIEVSGGIGSLFD